MPEKSLQTPDLFPAADDLNARYQGKWVQITAAGRRAEGTFVRCERVRQTSGGHVDRILIDYDMLWDLRWPERPVRMRANHNPAFPYCVFYAEDNPEIEIIWPYPRPNEEASADA